MSNVKKCTNCKKSGSMYREWSSDFVSFYEGFVEPTPLRYIQEFFPNISVSSYEEDYANNICPFCKHELIDTLISEDDFASIGEYSNYNRELLMAMIELRKKDIIEFETKMMPFRQADKEAEERMERNRQEYLAKKNLPKCPKCGSTSITTGARGVNYLWGFIGASKTVNRCGNCGHTWKP